MPRNYDKGCRSKTYKKPNPTDLANAVNAIKRKRMTYREAQEVYGIHYSVIYRHVKNEDIKKQGGQTSLSLSEEKLIIDNILLCAEWGFPLDRLDLRLLVKGYLDRRGKKVKRFGRSNMPGKEWAHSFLTRHSDVLAVRLCQNIKRCRAAVSRETINQYFDNLAISLEGIPLSHIINYDETNLTDDPGRRKIITKRGTRYPERIINSTKTSISIMFAACADGTLLPPYTVYKSKHLHDSWRIGGPKGARFNRSPSGWFDSMCFDDWIKSIALPYFSKLSGPKVLIGDNLSSHLSTDSIKLCKKNNIRFVFLPNNSTHLTQPLDVAFFRPLKIHWRNILEQWKKQKERMNAHSQKIDFLDCLNYCG